MARNDEALKSRKNRSTLSTCFKLLGVIAYAAVAVFVFRLLDRQDELLVRNAELRQTVGACQAKIDATAQRTLDRIHEIETSSRDYLKEAARDLRLQHSRSGAAVLDTSKELVAALERREVLARGEILTRLERAQKAISDLRQDLHQNVEALEKKENAFHEIQARWDPSILLIHSEFSYKSRNEEGKLELQTGCGWGTGFVVSKEGHVLTNKHVVQPWKFDPELCAMEAMGEVEIMTDSVKLSAWPSGTRCMDEARNLERGLGFNNTKLHNLKLYAVAEDNMTSKEMTLGGTSIPYKVHALDNNDLAILKVDGAKLTPIPCATVERENRISKLDNVMALGFPRGQNGLERGLAETSPSVGTVRKVEDTIHVTASIIPGNSGGPLFNEDGEVVGIATRIYSETLGICIRVSHGMDLLQRARKEELARKSSGSSADTAASPVILALTDN